MDPCATPGIKPHRRHPPCAERVRAASAGAVAARILVRPGPACHPLGFGSGEPNTVPAASVPCRPAVTMTAVAPGARTCRRPGRHLPADPVTSGQVVCPVAGPLGGGRRHTAILPPRPPSHRNPAAAAAVTPGPHTSSTAINPLSVRGVATGRKFGIPSADDPAGGRATFCPPTRCFCPPSLLRRQRRVGALQPDKDDRNLFESRADCLDLVPAGWFEGRNSARRNLTNRYMGSFGLKQDGTPSRISCIFDAHSNLVADFRIRPLRYRPTAGKGVKHVARHRTLQHRLPRAGD